MAQRFAFAVATSLIAFVVVLLGALGAYVALNRPVSTPAVVAQRTDAATASAQLPTPPPQQAQQVPGNTGTASDYPVSTDQAVNIALSNASGASLLQQPRLVNMNGTVAYEVSLDRGYVYVDATSGQVLYNGAGGNQRRRPRR